MFITPHTHAWRKWVKVINVRLTESENPAYNKVWEYCNVVVVVFVFPNFSYLQKWNAFVQLVHIYFS